MVSIKGTDKIFGEVRLSGAKNAALPLIVGACLCSEPVTLHNMPVELNDLKVMVDVLRDIGFSIEINGHSVTVSRSDEIKSEVPEEASKIRYSLLLLPLLITLTGSVSNPLPGGCNLGDRKYDIHLEALRKLGADIIEEEYCISGKAEKRLSGADLLFHIATTSGSEGAIIAAALAQGKTTVRNANTRPEVIDLIDFLNAMGADITYSTRYIEINGVSSLHGGEYTVLKDSHEAVSYMILATLMRSEIMIKDFDTRFIREDVALLEAIGADVFEWGGSVYLSAKGKELKPFSLTTAPYPGINSDMQPLFAALACTIAGESIITDTRFTERFRYVDEFKKLGADIVNYQNCAVIRGGKRLSGTEVWATDLRAGVALTLLGVWAQGETKIDNYYQTQRGYVNIIEKLRGLGVEISEI